MRSSSVWLLPAAVLSLCACYAEFPGSASIDDIASQLHPDAGQDGIGGTLSGGGLGGGVDAGMIEPSDAGDGDAGLVPNCDGVAIGTVQTRKLYEEAQVVPPATCKSEMQSRTCRNTGWTSWSGTFKSESCMQAAFHSCGDVAHGATESRERFAMSPVNDFNLCMPEEQTRECDDGTLGPWTGGSATLTTCEVAFLGKCSLLSDYACVSGTACTFKSFVSGSLCLGTTSHSCSANAECASGVCVNGACRASKVPVTGACDEAADCAACTGTVTTPVCTSANVCACSVGANCTANNQCDGTCVASKCVAANTTCDNDDDCKTITNKCVKTGAAATGTCLLKDGQTCTTNAQCEHVCRTADNDDTFATRICQPKGGSLSHCDENVDCSATFFCRPYAEGTLPLDQGTHCQPVGQTADLCDEAADCDATLSCTTFVCTPSVSTTGGPGGGPGGGGPGG